MATRLPPLNDIVPSSSLTTTGPATGLSSIHVESDFLKYEDSPTLSGFTSADPETPVAENKGSGPTAVAGRKRKANSTSSRGVANLTPDQLAKKRANDRQAQRAIRERTKAHIDSLEQQVRELSSQQPYLDLRGALKQNEAILAENRELRQGLKAVMEIIQPLLGKSEALNPSAHPAAAPQSTKPFHSTSTLSSFSENNNFTPGTRKREPSYAESIASVEIPSSPAHSTSTLGAGRRDSIHNLPSFRIAFDYQRQNLSHGLDFGTGERLGFNFLLDASRVPKVETYRHSSDNFKPPQVSSPSVNNTPVTTGPLSDQSLPAYLTPIRNIAPTCTLDAILVDFLHHRQREAAQGVPKQKLVGPPYPSVSSLLNPEKGAYSHPLSKVFTDILRTFPDISSLPEQVAVLYTMFLLMRWQIYPTPENYDRMPEWVTPRPSQILTPHPAWIDYLPWPRMRDRLVMQYQDYPFENWFIPFTRTLSVNWPYEATDCLLSTNDAEDLIINPVFERHLRNLNNWSLGPAFAEAFPALVETTRINNNR